MKNNRKLFAGMLLAVLLVLAGVGTVLAATREEPSRSIGKSLGEAART